MSFGEGPAPRDIPAECATLGAMILSPDALGDILEIVQPGDFYEPKHEEIAQTLSTMRDENAPTDLVTLADRLLSAGRLEKIGGRPYLHDLTESVPTAANGTHYADIVQKRAQQRRGAQLAIWLYQMMTNPDTDLDDIPELLATAGTRINEEIARVPGLGIPATADLLAATLDEAENPSNSPSIRTSWPDLNQVYKGHAPGQLVILGARPAMGKTLIALGMGRHAAVECGIPTLYITLEISERESMQRLLAAEAGIELSHLTDSCCTDQDWEKLAKAGAVLGTAPFFIHDVPTITVGGVRQAVDLANRTARAQYGAPVGLVIIDYLQIMKGDKTESRQLEVSGLSRGLKQYAKETGISIIACAQINRGPEQRSDKRPEMSDLRESGSLEADADNVILLHRESVHNPESPHAGEIELLIKKQRNGPSPATATLLFQGHRGRAVSYRRDPDNWTPHNAALPSPNGASR